MPKTRARTDQVIEQLKKLPGKPGCYIYKGEKGEVLYVGKALSLKNRVRSYFQESTRHGLRIERLVGKVRDIEWIVVDSEVEALVLECNLIKQHRPPYNVRLRDDKSYPYITITDEKFPRVLFTRKVRKDKAKYFGPYPSAYSVRDTLQTLHKVFPLIPCGKSWSGREEQKPCLYFHLGRCLAPCAGLADRDEYMKVINQVERFLQGKEEGIVIDLRREMNSAADALEFEKAAKIRDQVQAIENVLQRQKVLTSDRIDQDVVAVVKDERGAAIQMLYIRGGKLIGQRQFILDGAAEAPPGVAVQEFVKQYYSTAAEVPREVLLPVEIEERNIVQTWLRQRRGAAVTVDVPAGGERLRLVEMAATNAEEALSTFAEELQRQDDWAETAMDQLREHLGLDTMPMRIEGYDISNIQGTSPVGSMVVVENGAAAKDEYRRFKIRYHPESPNDFAMMHEVITRRLRAYLDGDEKFSKLPDLIMIDGGRGQLGAALKARDELGLSVPMVGLAKRLELLYLPVCVSESPSLLRDEGAEEGGVGEGGSGPLGEKPEIRNPKSEIQQCDDQPSLPRQEPLAELIEHEPALAVAVDGPAQSVHGSGEEAVDELGAVGPRAIPMAASANPKSKIQNPKYRDLEYTYDKPPERTYDYREVTLALNSPGLMLLRKLRDEAHRFALSYHRKIRDKRMHGSALEEIPGVGPRRKRLLLRTFGSVDGIRRATAEEIAAVPTMTMTLAKQIRDYLAEV
jgi:excinuclease ABC subunit C